MKQEQALAIQPDSTGGWSYYVDFQASTKGAPLTRRSRFEEEPIKLHVAQGKAVWVPRAMTPVGVKDCRNWGNGLKTAVNITPRSQKQADALNQTVKMVGERNGIIVAPTGFGKTVLGCAAIAQAKVSTCVLVHKSDLVDQWRDSFHKFLGIKNVPLWSGDNVPDPVDGLVIAMVQSVCKVDRYYPEVYQNFGMLIADEVHRMAATEFRKAIPRFPGIYRLGFSATPGRLDGSEFVFKAHMGEILFEIEGVPMPPKVYLQNTGFRPITSYGKLINPKPGKTNYADKLLWQNHDRNERIVMNIKRLHELGRKTVVFSATKAHLALLSQRIGPIPNGFYIGGMPKADLDKSATMSVCFATYKMGSEGTDKPWWDACVLASPLSHIIQPVGRVTREYPGKKTPIVVDFVDQHPLWEGYALSRIKEYDAIGASVSRS